MADPRVVSLISQGARARQLDPRAVLAVASREGLGGGIGDQGTSYGPFQLHKGGAYPGYAPQNPTAAQAWAMSPAGINYALNQMGAARGLTGGRAIRALVTQFERPANPGAEIQGAINAYGGINPTPGAGSLNYSPYETAGTLRARGSTPMSTNAFSSFAQSLINNMHVHTPEAMLGAVMQLRQDLDKMSPVANQHSASMMPGFSVAPPQNPGKAMGTVQQGTEKGMQTSFAVQLNKLIKAVGNLSITSGYRSPEEQTTLWNNAVKKYGSPAEAQKWVAPPGHSNHNKGLAADLGGNLQLAHKLAAQYGLTFPMSWEPWHIEPVGIRG